MKNIKVIEKSEQGQNEREKAERRKKIEFFRCVSMSLNIYVIVD
jgi:hypothetical protein